MRPAARCRWVRLTLTLECTSHACAMPHRLASTTAPKSAARRIAIQAACSCDHMIFLRNPLPRPLEGFVIDFDEEKVDRTVLALLYLTLHDKYRAWKSFDWDVMTRLYEKGFIGDPVNQAKSVVLTDEGLAESKRLFEELFGKR